MSIVMVMQCDDPDCDMELTFEHAPDTATLRIIAADRGWMSGEALSKKEGLLATVRDGQDYCPTCSRARYQY